MKKIILILLCTVILAIAAGCSASNEKIGIRGEIREVVLNDGKVTNVLVEGTVDQDTQYDKASVQIDEKTEIFVKETGKKVTAGDLKEGTRVEVVFKGGVRESYPVQADAKVIRILQGG